jgi:hypothetical protein
MSTTAVQPLASRTRVGAILTVARRWWLPLLAVIVVSVAGSGGTASAATPEHVKRSVVAPPVDLPAGAVCDFAYHQESSYTQNLTLFFDPSGNLIRVEDIVDITVLHRNADTGYTLVEEDHYAAYVDFPSGVAKTSGQSWALRDANGRLVLSGAGLLTTDLATGALLTQTSHVKDTRQILCSALGGAAAP